MNEEYLCVSDLRGVKSIEPTDSFVVLDIETTGLKYNDDIIEFSAIKVKDNVVIDKTCFFIKPLKEIPYFITELTGIDYNMLSEAKPFQECIEDIISFIGNDIIIGHNVTFDIDRLNYKIYTLTGKNINNNFIDTMYLAQQRISNIENYQLSTVANYLKIEITNSHRALDDCYTTLKCYNKLIDMPYTDIDNTKRAYHFINRCHNLEYEKKDDAKALDGMYYLLLGNPYYASPERFMLLLEKHGASQLLDYYKISDIEDLIYLIKSDTYVESEKICRSSDSRILTHLVICESKYPTYKQNSYIENLEKAHSVKVIKESDIYNILGINIPKITTLQGARLSQKNIQATTNEFNTEHILYNKTIVITGSLNSMTRADAYQQIKNIGGLCGDNVTRKTNYLVTNSVAMTGKMKKAVEYKNQGQDIEVINEEQLIKLLHS